MPKRSYSGLLITAAFIGPGTVTTATLAGANFGYTLIWALVFSIFCTLVLQEMAARLGLVTGQGLSQAMKSSISSPLLRQTAMLLVVAAIGIGNAAYEAGNLTGAAIGLTQVLGGNISTWAMILGVSAAVLLTTRHYKRLEVILTMLVLLMSAVFVATMFMARPDVMGMLSALLMPSLPSGALLTTIALIGTTVVPYNLFLHANLTARHHSPDEDIKVTLKACRYDSGLSIGLGGLITLAILSTAAVAFYQSGTEVNSGNLASQLEPLLGEYAQSFFALGLFAAGLTSSITAPLAASYAVCGAMGWPIQLNSAKFRMVWITVILAGVIFAGLGTKPIVAILFAQATNGILLPIIACFLLWVMNQKTLLGEYCNSPMTNLIAGVIVLFISALGLYKVVSLLL